MKTLSTLVILLCLNSCIYGQWKWLNPQPSGYDNEKITFVSPTTGFLFNTQGDLFKSVDSGAHWQFIQNFPGKLDMALNDSTGFMIGLDSNFYVSIDNGNSWSLRVIQLPVQVNRIQILNRDTILLFNEMNGRVYKSFDRGVSFTSMGVQIPACRRIDFITSDIGFAASYNGIYKTINGGNTWTLVRPANTAFIKFSDALNGYACTNDHWMIKTTNGGLDWTIGSSIAEEIFDLKIISTTVAFAVGQYGIVYKTTDAGNSWINLSPGFLTAGTSLSTLWFFNANHGIVAGEGGRIFITSNGAQSWKPQAPTYITVTDVSMGDVNTGYATTWNNIYKTTNKGLKWDSLPLVVGTDYGSGTRFETCNFFSADTGIVTTKQPVRFYKTTTGGSTWTTFSPLLFGAGYSSISSMQFLNSQIGFANLIAFTPSLANALFKTTDGGNTWQIIGNNNFNKVFYVNDNIAYASLNNQLQVTLNGGQQWYPAFTFPSNQMITGIFFINASKGFVAGENGLLSSTQDSGRTWTSHNLVSSSSPLPDYTNINFFNSKIGYVTDGWNCYKTFDGGKSWKQQLQPLPGDAIKFSKDSLAYIAGNSGAILSNAIAEYRIDSLQISNVNACSASFSGLVSAALSSVDSIWFEYGTTAFDHTVSGVPISVNDSTVKSLATVSNLLSGANYKVRIRVFYKGSFRYSNILSFNTSVLPIPLISANGNILTSSAATSYQWYINGQIIPGATASQFAATTSGIYTVQTVQNGCTAPVSAGYNFIITGVIETIFAGDVKIFPNPVSDHLTIKNDRYKMLQLTLLDVTGRKLQSLKSNKKEIIITFKGMSAGIYFLSVDAAGSTIESTTIPILKQ